MNLSSLTALVTKYLRVFRYGERTRPIRDWFVIASLVLILFIGSAGWSFFIFHKTSTGELAGKAVQAPVSVPITSLDTVRGIFENRAAERMHYLSDYHFVDPSR